MEEYFYQLAQLVENLSLSDELCCCYFEAEDADYVRFNQGRVRQAGTVLQRAMNVALTADRRPVSGSCCLTGSFAEDSDRLRDLVRTLRAQRACVDRDPHLNYALEVNCSRDDFGVVLPDSRDVIGELVEAGHDLDLVGLWASGMTYTGFANSCGQRNWHCRSSFNLDYSAYLSQDTAVKDSYAGFSWHSPTLRQRLDHVREQLALLQRPTRTLAPGRYRAYLAPTALHELFALLGWQGFGLKSHRTRQTPLLRMREMDQRLNPAFSLYEDHNSGMTPRFTAEGFVKPKRVALIEAGAYQECLTAARSAMEFGVPVNASIECPESLRMAAGDIEQHKILEHLGTGLYISNLWYCNFSDPNHCRLTGMTRYACYWVENATLRQPIDVMRFDDTLYHLLGHGLVGVTAQQTLLFDADSYGKRSLATMRLPGVIVDGLTLTL
jgi:predicted Zn-dependent protease